MKGMSGEILYNTLTSQVMANRKANAEIFLVEVTFGKCWRMATRGEASTG